MEESEDELDNENMISLPKLTGEDLEMNTSISAKEEQRTAAGIQDVDDPFLKASIPRIVFCHAIKAIPNDVAFRFAFLEKCQCFGGLTEAEEDVWTSLMEDFTENDEVRAKFAEHYVNGVHVDTPEYVDALKRSIEQYYKALKTAVTAELVEHFLKFVRKQWCHVHEPHLKLFLEAVINNRLTGENDLTRLLNENACVEYVEFLLNANKKDQAREFMDKMLKDQYPASESLWLLRLKVNEKQADLYRVALQKLPYSVSIWRQYLDLLEEILNNKGATKEVVDNAYKEAVVRTSTTTQMSGHDEERSTLQIRYVEWSKRLGGVEAFLRAYQTVVRSAFASPAFARHCIQTELQVQPSPSEREARHHRLTTMFEDALKAGPKDIETHVLLIHWHLNECRFSQATIAYKHANTIVEDKNELAQRYEVLLQGRS